MKLVNHITLPPDTEPIKFMFIENKGILLVSCNTPYIYIFQFTNTFFEHNVSLVGYIELQTTEEHLCNQIEEYKEFIVIALTDGLV